MPKIILNGVDYYESTISSDGSSGHNYSTQEQVVGTWIDGKPLYEITLDFGSISANSAKTIDVSSLNIDYVTSFDSTARLDNGIIVPIPISHTVNMGSQHFCRYNAMGNFGIYTGSGQAITQAYLTARYTKIID